MKTLKSVLSPIAAALCIALAATPMSAGAMELESGSDQAFNAMIGKMAARDTGSGWFDYYVSVLNQEIALFEGTQPYGAAGPSGPLDAFNGYIANFRMPDTGSTWFNNYVDAVNFVIRQKESLGN